MPFAAAQIGLGFRNEIAPRNGLLRVREFTMAEIEHFVNPRDKSHPKFASVAHNVLTLFPQDAQLGSGRTLDMSIGEAVASGLVNNETLGYFMARTQLYALSIGVHRNKMRFRQHLRTEMSHYAADCWDLEIQLSYGWIECVGHADRACFDLTQHSLRTGVALTASERLPQPIVVEKLSAEANKKLLGPAFKTAQKDVLLAIESLSEEDAVRLQEQLQASNSASVTSPATSTVYEISKDMVSFKREKKTVSETKFTPSVVEPSFGIGRVLYAVLEHAFSQRAADAQRCVMSFRPRVAPIKVGIFRLINHVPFDIVIDDLRSKLQGLGLALRVDSSSGSVGRRYARADELGVPFGVTIDFQTLLDQTVTLRERDSMQQVRVSLSLLPSLLVQLCEEVVDWNHVASRFMRVQVSEDDEEESKEAADGNASSKPAAPESATVVQQTKRGAFSRPAITLRSKV